MADCTIPGDESMYGVGIRVGFYFLWFGIIFSSWIAEHQISLLRLANLLFSGAMFLALIIRVTSQLSSSISTSDPAVTSSSSSSVVPLRAVEIHLILLLAFGYFFFLVPVYVWRLLTCCNPLLDLTRWPKSRTASTGKVGGVLTWLLVVGLAGFQMWFWCEGIRKIPPLAISAREGESDEEECIEWAFLMAKIELRDTGMVAVNIIFNAAVLFVAFLVMITCSRLFRGWRRRHRGISDERRSGLQQLQNIFSLLVASLSVLAIELIIEWNGLNSKSTINTITSASQTIPLILGLGLFLRVFYKWRRPDPVHARSRRDSHGSSGYGSNSHGHSHGHGRGGGGRGGGGGGGGGHERRDSMASTGYGHSYGSGSPRRGHQYQRQQQQQSSQGRGAYERSDRENMRGRHQHEDAVTASAGVGGVGMPLPPLPVRVDSGGRPGGERRESNVSKRSRRTNVVSAEERHEEEEESDESVMRF